MVAVVTHKRFVAISFQTPASLLAGERVLWLRRPATAPPQKNRLTPLSAPAIIVVSSRLGPSPRSRHHEAQLVRTAMAGHGPRHDAQKSPPPRASPCFGTP